MSEPTSTERGGGLGCAARFFWMGAGNAVLAFLLVFIAQRSGFRLGALDLAYLVTVAALVAVRFVDIRYLAGRTTEGEPATLPLWRRYSAVTVVVGAALWGAAHLLGLAGWLR